MQAKLVQVVSLSTVMWNWSSRDNAEKADRSVERHGREDAAPRLHAEVPGLTSLQFDVEDGCGVVWGTRYTRRIVVDQAPALFLVPCGDPRCVGDAHDLTVEVMRALRSQETSFHGEEECAGSVGSSGCPHVLRFKAVASYCPSSGTPSEPPRL